MLNAVKHPLSVIDQGVRGVKYIGKLATVLLQHGPQQVQDGGILLFYVLFLDY